MIEELRKKVSYDPASGLLFWRLGVRRAGQQAFASNAPGGYLKGQFKQKSLLAHRVAWAIQYGEWPEQIDHINGDRTDNRLANLRSVSASENQRNKRRPKNNTTGVVGVYWEPLRSKWRADVTLYGKTKLVGRFESKDDAIAARKAAERNCGHHENHGRH